MKVFLILSILIYSSPSLFASPQPNSLKCERIYVPEKTENKQNDLSINTERFKNWVQSKFTDKLKLINKIVDLTEIKLKPLNNQDKWNLRKELIEYMKLMDIRLPKYPVYSERNYFLVREKTNKLAGIKLELRSKVTDPAHFGFDLNIEMDPKLASILRFTYEELIFKQLLGKINNELTEEFYNKTDSEYNTGLRFKVNHKWIGNTLNLSKGPDRKGNFNWNLNEMLYPLIHLVKGIDENLLQNNFELADLNLTKRIYSPVIGKYDKSTMEQIIVQSRLAYEDALVVSEQLAYELGYTENPNKSLEIPLFHSNILNLNDLVGKPIIAVEFINNTFNSSNSIDMEMLYQIKVIRGTIIPNSVQNISEENERPFYIGKLELEGSQNKIDINISSLTGIYYKK